MQPHPLGSASRSRERAHAFAGCLDPREPGPTGGLHQHGTPFRFTPNARSAILAQCRALVPHKRTLTKAQSPGWWCNAILAIDAPTMQTSSLRTSDVNAEDECLTAPTPYVHLPGSAQDALDFYGDVFGCEVELAFPRRLQQGRRERWLPKVHVELPVSGTRSYLHDSVANMDES